MQIVLQMTIVYCEYIQDGGSDFAEVMAYPAGYSLRTTSTNDWARECNPFILYMKHPELPGEYSDIAAAGTVFKIEWDKEGSDNFIAEELDAMMPVYLKRKEQNEREAKGQRSSKRRRDPVTSHWISYSPPPSLSHRSLMCCPGLDGALRGTRRPSLSV